VFLENVAAITSLGGLSVVGTLASLGYDTRAGTLRASTIGAPHQRNRWFCVATHPECGSVQRQRNTGKLASEERPAKQLRRDTSTGSDQEAATNTDGARRGEQRGAVPMGEKLVSPECGSGASWGEYAPAIRHWEQVLGRAAPDPLVDGQLNHWLVEWMMGLSPGHVCSIAESRTAALRCLGNGVVPQQGYAALQLLTKSK